MAGNTQFAGRVYISVNGARLRSKSGAKLNIGGVERSPVETDLGTLGYTEKTKTSMVECTVVMAKDTDLTTLGAIVDSTLVFETDIGVSYVLKDAFITDPPDFAGGDGEIGLKFAGTRCERV